MNPKLGNNPGELWFLAQVLRHRRTGENARECADRLLACSSMTFTRGNQKKAADLLGVALKTFKLLAKDHRLRPTDRWLDSENQHRTILDVR